MIESSFQEYQETVSSKSQRSLLLICFIVSLVILGIELFTYNALLHQGERVVLSFRYIFIRICSPTILNFGSFAVAFFIVRNTNLSLFTRNLAVSINIFVICSVLAIFHNFFQILLVSTAIPFLICCIFGDIRITRVLVFLTIPSVLISYYCYWTDNASGTSLYKSLSMICNTAFVISAYFYSRTIVSSQANQFDYVRRNYKKQFELVEELKIEPLTRLCNRSAMDISISGLIHRAERQGITPFMVMLDIDYFKRVNDKYGHNAGDEVLKALADIIREEMRSYRNAFRFGGEEFVLLFATIPPVNVFLTVESIRSKFAGTRFSFAPEESFTLSGGVSMYRKEYDALDWIDATDKALYYSKEHGRNQIKVAE